MSYRFEQEPVTAVRIPADVDREDRILANLTARQVAILSVTGLGLYALYAATHVLLPPLVFLLLAAPVAFVAGVVVLGTRDGLSLDRLLAAGIRQRFTPRVQVAAPGGIPVAPAWITANATYTGADSGQPVRPRALHLPAESVTDGGAGSTAGVIDLGPDGLATVCVCSMVNFALRTAREQEALVASFGRYLHSLTAPIQILVRAQRLDLSGQILELREQAGGLPHPALEQAALEHADYLAELATQSDLLRRQVLLVLREPVTTGALPSAAPRAMLGMRRGRRRQVASLAARHAAETRLGRRLVEAAALLSATGIAATPLDTAQASAILRSATNPDSLIPPNVGLAGPHEVISRTVSTDLSTDLDDEPIEQPPGDVSSRNAEAGEPWWS